MLRKIASTAIGVAWALFATAATGANVSIVSMQYSKAHPVPHIVYEGETEAGDLAKLQEIYDRFVHCRTECAPETGRPTAIVSLQGPGGNYHVGLHIADFFRANSIATVVEKGTICMSACAFSFLGGTGYSGYDRIGQYIDRMIEPGGIVGFHAPYRDEATLRSALAERSAETVLGESRDSLSLMVKEMVKWNIDPEIMHYLMNMGPSQTYNIIGADDYYLLRTALPPIPSSAWIADIPTAIRNACIRLLALFERADPLELRDRITAPFTEGISTTAVDLGSSEAGERLSGYHLSDQPLEVGHCSATDESIASGTDLAVSLYMYGINGSVPLLSFHNRDGYFSTAGIGASPLKRVYQRGGLSHWFLPVGVDVAALETSADMLIRANKFETIAPPELPPLPPGFVAEQSDMHSRVSRNGNIWMFEQVGSAELYETVLADSARGVTLSYDSVAPNGFLREGTFANGTMFSVTAFRDEASSIVVRTLLDNGGQPPSSDELATIRAAECNVVLGTMRVTC